MTALWMAGTRTMPDFAEAPGVVMVAGSVPTYDVTGQYRIGVIGISGATPEADGAWPTPVLRSLVCCRTGSGNNGPDYRVLRSAHRGSYHLTIAIHRL